MRNPINEIHSPQRCLPFKVNQLCRRIKIRAIMRGMGWDGRTDPMHACTDPAVTWRIAPMCLVSIISFAFLSISVILSFCKRLLK